MAASIAVRVLHLQQAGRHTRLDNGLQGAALPLPAGAQQRLLLHGCTRAHRVLPHLHAAPPKDCQCCMAGSQAVLLSGVVCTWEGQVVVSTTHQGPWRSLSGLPQEP
jgi:hypothetical protein